MIKSVGIKYDYSDKIFYVNLNNNNVKKNITVIVDQDSTLYFGKVVTDSIEINEEKITGKIIRISTKKDYSNYKNNKKIAEKAMIDAKKLAQKYNLNMTFIDNYFTFDKDQLLFHFYSEDRIDFRNLARDLASIYKTRIELRQIGVRDKAKKIGGQGCCGQQLCCARFLDNFDSVSISMAKNQNLSLNPNKINGVCGRLLCCLKYENECYKECKKDMPNIGQVVETPNGKGVVVDVNLLNKKYKLDIENIGIVEVSLKDDGN